MLSADWPPPLEQVERRSDVSVDVVEPVLVADDDDDDDDGELLLAAKAKGDTLFE